MEVYFFVVVAGVDGLELAEAEVFDALCVSAADPPDEGVRGVPGVNGNPGAAGVVGVLGGVAGSGDTE